MIIIGALVALFLVFLLLKRHVGPAILASFAGCTVYNSIHGFSGSLSDLTHIPSNTISLILFLLLVLVLPLIIYILSAKNWSPMIVRILFSAVAAVVITSFCTSITDFYEINDAIGKNILNFITANYNIIDPVGILFAYFDTIFYRV